MSSQRLRKIFAATVRSLRDQVAPPSSPDGPTCGCASCVEAWQRNQPRMIAREAVNRHRRFGLG